MSLTQNPAPLVSVVIPVFNRQETAVASVRSVLAQGFSDFELIVVDDGSIPPFVLPDDLMGDARIRLVRQQVNGGAGSARNAGARAARGTWLAWLDSDDEWLPNKLQAQIDFIGSTRIDPKRTALATGFQYRFADGRQETRLPIASDEPKLFFSGCWFCPGSTVMVGRESFLAVGPYDPNMSRLEDVDWFGRFALAGGSLAVLPEVLAIVHLGARPAYDRVKAAGDYLRQKYGADPMVDRVVYRHLLAYLELEYAASLLKGRKRVLKGAGSLIRSWLLVPRLTLQLHRFWR